MLNSHTSTPTVLKHIHIRATTKADAPALADVFIRSFNAPFFQYLFPNTPFMRSWWIHAWTKGTGQTDRPDLLRRECAHGACRTEIWSTTPGWQ